MEMLLDKNDNAVEELHEICGDSSSILHFPSGVSFQPPEISIPQSSGPQISGVTIYRAGNDIKLPRAYGLDRRVRFVISVTMRRSVSCRLSHLRGAGSRSDPARCCDNLTGSSTRPLRRIPRQEDNTYSKLGEYRLLSSYHTPYLDE